MKKFLDYITPNKSLSSSNTLTIVLIWIVGTLALWITTSSHFFPKPLEIIEGGHKLFVHNNFLEHLIISTWLCLKAIFYASFISLFVALMVTIPALKPLANIAGKARFLSTVGLTFIFAQITKDTNTLKVSLLIFCICVFMVTSFLSVIKEIKKDDIDYAKSLKMNDWKILWEIFIRGKADQYLEAIRQNFAISWIMLAMVENLCRAEGGIGVLLFQEDKQFHLSSVYAIQMVVLFVGIGIDKFLGFLRGFLFPYSVLTLHK